MTQDIQQWLAEMKGLQQKLAEVQQERDQAYLSATNWRNRYETEATQRRNDLQAAQETIAALKAELAAYQRPNPDATEYGAILRQQVDQWQTTEELKTQLVQALLERDRLMQAVEAEQQAHAQTRQDLTTALGDTMDLLAKVRKRKQAHAHTTAAHTTATVVPLRPEPKPEAKTPSPVPPPPDPA